VRAALPFEADFDAAAPAFGLSLARRAAIRMTKEK
jgi:hypothetical protein